MQSQLHGVPDDELGGGFGFEHLPDERCRYDKTVTGPDRVAVAEGLEARLRDLGYEAGVRHQR